MKTYFVPQGISADIIATEYGFTRDDADALAVESQRRAARAWEEGRFARSVLTVRDRNGLPILDRDEYMRPGTDMQSLGALKPAFKEMGEVMPGFDKGRADEVPASRADRAHPPRRQLERHRRRRGGAPDRVEGLRRGWA
jgi:acetyl-CoA acetyltransferase